MHFKSLKKKKIEAIKLKQKQLEDMSPQLDSAGMSPDTQRFNRIITKPVLITSCDKFKREDTFELLPHMVFSIQDFVKVQGQSDTRSGEQQGDKEAKG